MIDTQAIRTKILDLAMRGKLTEQLPKDGTAEDLFQQIQEEKEELAKNEYETQITKEEYHQLMQIVRGNVISKTRYVRRVNDGLIYDIDVCEGEFSGLAYLEIEFQDSATAASYPDPEWVESDVTYFPEFKNSALAKYGMPPMS